jgi:hypothetical protein
MHVVHSNGLHLNRNAAFALKVHAVENLVAHLAWRYGTGCLKKPVGKRRLPMIYVGDD